MSIPPIPIHNTTLLHHELYRGWMPNPPIRSTLSILQTCLFTIFLCVHTAVHLNIPEPGERAIWQTLRRAKWITVAILAPEIVLQLAWRQFVVAWGLRKVLRQRVKEQGGRREGREGDGNSNEEYLLRKPGVGSDVKELNQAPDESDITLTYAFYVLMGGMRIRTAEGTTYCVTPAGVRLAAKQGLWWPVSTTSIKDKSKADTIAKVLTVLQVSWMLVQCITRKVVDLPITLLELHTFIHVICAALMFGLWFQKPLDIRDATTISPPTQDPSLLDQLLHPDGGFLVIRQVNLGHSWFEKPSFRKKYSLVGVFHAVAIGDYMDDSASSDTWSMYDLIGLVLVQIVYGSLHMAAWNANFPSLFEQRFWQSSCLTVIAAYGVVLLLLSCLFDLEKVIRRWQSLWADPLNDVLDIFRHLVVFGLIGVLVVARLFIVVESVISLREVPIGVYATIPWSGYVPHI